MQEWEMAVDRETMRKAKAGDIAARNKILTDNINLIRSTVGRMRFRGKSDYEDLIQAGLLGMMRAIELYNPRKGEFSTYATPWIFQAAMMEATENARTIQLPRYCWDKKQKGKGLALRRRADKIKLGIVSLNHTPDDAKPISDTLPDSETPTIEKLLAAERADRLWASMSRVLNVQQRRVLCLRYGLLGKKSHTLEEVGKILGNSRERVRQIEWTAIDRLKWSLWNY